MTKKPQPKKLVPVQVRLREPVAEALDVLVERLRAEKPGLRYSRAALCTLFVEIGILAYQTSGELPTVASSVPELDRLAPIARPE